MAYIKRLVMKGFKSFVKKTELPFTPGINVILGPNGSGKSNVSDALCFVLGRLSAKSMRAAKAKNLIFLGTQNISPAKEASVEIIFDNSDNTFSMDKREVSLRRIVRKSGQSIYKINGETKTRQDVLALLAQAGIDPNGFNLILQGEIQNFVRMHTEERRKIIEEVAGISIYESRKAKSLKELEKTEEKLKESSAILRERTAYLNNLEKERQEALRFKRLEKDVKKYKASIIAQDIKSRKKDLKDIEINIEKKDKEIEKQKKKIANVETVIKNYQSKIDAINSTIESSTGLEQEKLNSEIANLRAELAGLNVNLENYEKRLRNIITQKEKLEETIKTNEEELVGLQKVSPTMERNAKELKNKKEVLEKLEIERKKFYTTKTELKSIKDRLVDKEVLLQNYKNESNFLLKQIDSLAEDLFDKNTTVEKVEELKISLAEKKETLESLSKKEMDLEKNSHTNEYEIDKQNKLIENISKLDVCPVCKNKITEKHVCSISEEIAPKIDQLKKEIEEGDKELSEIYQKKQMLKEQMENIESEISKRESDIIKLRNVNEKKEQIKNIQEQIENVSNEIKELSKRKKSLEINFDKNSNIEERFETISIEVQDISMRTKENVNSEISLKQREIERAQISFKQLFRDEEDIAEELKSVKNIIKEKESVLKKKREKEAELAKKFEKLITERDGYQKQIRENEYSALNDKNIIHNLEQAINNYKIDKARIGAEIENLDMEMLSYPNIEIISTNKENLRAKLMKAQDILSRIGSVNLRSLEVYDSVKGEYDSIQEKVDIISREKEGILKIVKEIDIKKKKAFIHTLNELNEIFSRNFSQLSTKGQVTLELENRKDPFDGGVNIIVKTGHGKYFDVTSLSGGEQTLVALSLIFAIQELKPYCFYVLDEIDAALDKRNSSRLAGLLKKYMKKGQYIVISHSDEIITNATNLFGVSMHDGVSKVISLDLEEDKKGD